MSRVGKKPIPVPAGVTATIEDGVITVTGPKGTLTRTLRPEVTVRIADGVITVGPKIASKKTAAFWGMTRALIHSMAEGVTKGFEKKLEIEGIGYRATLEGESLQFALGYSHPIKIEPPAGITFKVEKNVVTISGVNAERVGDIASRIRDLRPPEPYKGKGIRYQGEVIRRKAGKKAVSAGG